MYTALLLAILLVAVDSTTIQSSSVQSNCQVTTQELLDTELVYSFVIFRHGDRTPKEDELSLAPAELRNVSLYPYGHQALTNRGKRREYDLGKQLRCRYDGFIDKTYLPDQTVMNTTRTDRTKMSASLVLAGLYPPTQEQTWLEGLNWQPIPYFEHPNEGRDFDGCPRHAELLSELMETPKYKSKIEEYNNTFKELIEITGREVMTIDDLRHLREAMKGLINMGVTIPDWYERFSKELDGVATLSLSSKYENETMIQLAAGAYLNSFMEAASAIVSGKEAKPRLQLLSAHETSVAGFMSAARVFEPHVPKYGASFALELRRNVTSGKYVVAAVYAESPESEPRLLPVPHCNDGDADDTKFLCDYSTFQRLTDSVSINRQDAKIACRRSKM